MFDRPVQIKRKTRFIERYLKEYIGGSNSSVLDIGCGAGTHLECMRHFGHEIMGTELGRFSFLESQDIPHINHDCHDMPYPFKDSSYGLVTCMGVLGQLSDPIVPDVFKEFFRISSDTVLIRVNSTEIMGRFSTIFDHPPSGWKQIFNDRIVVKYRKEGK